MLQGNTYLIFVSLGRSSKPYVSSLLFLVMLLDSNHSCVINARIVPVLPHAAHVRSIIFLVLASKISCSLCVLSLEALLQKCGLVKYVYYTQQGLPLINLSPACRAPFILLFIPATSRNGNHDNADNTDKLLL